MSEFNIRLTFAAFLGVALLVLVVQVYGQGKDISKPAEHANSSTEPDTKTIPDRVIRSDAEWRRVLTPVQYWVTRQKGTEPAWTGKYARGHYSGVFTCACCGAPLFSSKNKFDSGTGWPSYDRPIDSNAITTAIDTSLPFETRVEVECRRCGAHLGHVFEDGPTITGLRYCINSVALKLEPAPSKARTKPAAKTASKKTEDGP